MIPALNDDHLENVLATAAGAGACFAGYVMLRLPREVNPLFKDWLAEHYPLRADRVMNRVRDVRDGRESDSQFGRRMKGTGEIAQLIEQRFRRACREHGLNKSAHRLNTDLFVAPRRDSPQLALF